MSGGGREEVARGVGEEVERRAIDAALNFLSYRQRTGREVRLKLAARGFSEPAIEVAMRRLAAVGLVDDEAFIAAYVRDRVAHRPMGLRRMVRELYAKGIAREVSAPVVEKVLRDEGVDERELARRVIEKRRLTSAGRTTDASRQRNRLREQLLRRGFEPRVVDDVVDDLCREAAAPVGEDAGKRG